MPTYEALARFLREYGALSPQARQAFLSALDQFIEHVDAGTFPPSLRVKRIQGTRGLWEMSWAPDGRAVFEYGEPQHGKGRHVVWRRIGTHDVFRDP
ncbi:MAG: hypothetical protein IH609_09840 [Dehalococcoidia bacterium]|nr:hypothetical protein [Dehalococcoidia bacterium]